MDIAIFGSNWTKLQATTALSKLGIIENVKDMKTGIITTDQQTQEITQGFFVHLEIDGIIFDLKFYDTVQIALERGYTNIEKIFINLDRPLNEITSMLTKNKRSQLKIIDPHQGYKSTLNKKMKIINWPALKVTPIKRAIHIARLHGKGFNYSDKDFIKLKNAISDKPFNLNGVDDYYIERLFSRDQSSKTYNFLKRLDVLSHIENQRSQISFDLNKWINEHNTQTNAKACYNQIKGA